MNKENISNKKHDNRSIGALKPISYWVTVVGSSFTISLGVVTGLTSLLSWYEIPPKISNVKPKLIISALLIVICCTLIGFLLFLVKDYRRRYHLHRDKGLVRDLYPDRSRLYGHYGDVLEKSEKVFTVVGISLHTLITNSEFKNIVAETLALKKDLKIHLVFLKPYSEVVTQREKEEDRHYGRISQDCGSNIKEALKIKNQLGENGSRFHVHVCENVAPIAFMLLSDEGKGGQARIRRIRAFRTGYSWAIRGLFGLARIRVRWA